MKIVLLVVAFIPTILFSQSRKEKKALEAQQKADEAIISNLKNHIHHLSGASLAGQEANATEYISDQFKLIGLQPRGTDGFTQPYAVNNGKKIDLSTYLKVNDKQLEVNNDFFPLSYSAEKKIKGMPAMALRERGVPWFFDLKDWFEDGSKVQSGTVDEAIKKEVVKVAGKGASALFLYNSGSTNDGVTFNSKDRSPASTIPVVYITSVGLKKYFSDKSDVLDIELNVAFKENVLTGKNVIGYLDNAAATTTIISADYSGGNSKSDTKTGAVAASTIIAADDNATGVAALIELARMLSASKAKSNNYVFIGLGGPDNGVTAINYWLDNSATTSQINYNLHLDMSGSYNESKKLLVQGYQTSPVWNDIFKTLGDNKVAITVDSSSITNDPTTSFYKKGIPELSFSLATRTDITTTADEEGKINYAGILQVAKFIDRLVEVTDTKGKLAFSTIPQTQHTLEASTIDQPVKNAPKTNEIVTTAPKASVSLGVVADKMNSQAGLKINGVTPKKLASKLGLQPGDVLTNLGAYKISDFKSYMDALSNFKTGDKTTLRIKRGKDDKEFAVEF